MHGFQLNIPTSATTAAVQSASLQPAPAPTTDDNRTVSTSSTQHRVHPMPQEGQPGAPSSANPIPSSASRPLRGSITEDRLARAERILANTSTATPLVRHNLAVLKALCHKRDIHCEEKDTRERLAQRLIDWVRK